MGISGIKNVCDPIPDSGKMLSHTFDSRFISHQHFNTVANTPNSMIASSSRSAIRVARALPRATLQPIPTVIRPRTYASTSDVETSRSTGEQNAPVYVAPSSIRKNVGGAVMKKYTGPGFPKIPVRFPPTLIQLVGK